MEDLKGEINRRAIELVESGYRGTPLAQAAESIVREQEEQRRRILKMREQGLVDGPLDPELFPPDTFDEHGNRLMDDGRYRMTLAENGLAFEREDSRW